MGEELSVKTEVSPKHNGSPGAPAVTKFASGAGLTVKTKVEVPHVLLTVIFATCPAGLAGGVNAGMSPVPLAAKPIPGLSLVQLLFVVVGKIGRASCRERV